MILHRAHRFRLEPTAAQADQLGQIIGACRYVYNLALEQRRDWWRQHLARTGRHITQISQSYEVTQLRAQVPWLADVPRDALDFALLELEHAFAAFFAGRTKYPGFRGKDGGAGFTVRGRAARVERLNAKWARVNLPKVGWVKFRLTRDLPLARAKTISVREAAGEWHASFAHALERGEPTAPSASIGIDRGVANTLALSTGELLQIPARLSTIERRRKRAQRTLARRVKGSKRRAKARANVAILHAQARRIRRDWAHQTTTDIAHRFGLVAIEALDIRTMTASASGTIEEPGSGVAQKRGLNRSILSQGWGQAA